MCHLNRVGFTQAKVSRRDLLGAPCKALCLAGLIGFSLTSCKPDRVNKAASEGQQSKALPELVWPSSWKVSGHWSAIESRFISLRYSVDATISPDPQYVAVIQGLSTAAQIALDDVAAFLHLAAEPVTLVLPASSPMAAELTKNAQLQGDIAVTTTIENNSAWLVIDPQWLSRTNQIERTTTLHHEMTHVFLRADSSAIPRWFSEGVAQWVSVWSQKGKSESEREDLERQLLRSGRPASNALNTTKAGQDMTPGLPPDAAFYQADSQASAYAKALAAIVWVARRGPTPGGRGATAQKFADIHAAMRAGDPVEKLLDQYFKITISALVSGAQQTIDVATDSSG